MGVHWRERVVDGLVREVVRVWQRDPLAFAIATSVVLHALVLALRFVPPLPSATRAIDPQLEVILVNARTRDTPSKATLLAQENLVGGGENEHGRARSPLQAQAEVRAGDALNERQRRVVELEARQRELLSLAHGAHSRPASAPDARAPDAVARGEDADDVDRTIARLQAQIDRQISDYNKRPRRLTFGVDATGVSYARYVNEWAERIERIGTERYPPAARGRLYGSLVITVEIARDGSVANVIVNRGSGHEVLDRAVRDIVQAGAPYERFTPQMAREGDILQIVRTWNFTNGALHTSSVAESARQRDAPDVRRAPVTRQQGKQARAVQ